MVDQVGVKHPPGDHSLAEMLVEDPWQIGARALVLLLAESSVHWKNGKTNHKYI